MARNVGQVARTTHLAGAAVMRLVQVTCLPAAEVFAENEKGDKNFAAPLDYGLVLLRNSLVTVYALLLPACLPARLSHSRLGIVLGKCQLPGGRERR